MAILPINITVTPTWIDITTSVNLLELIEEETVEIYHDGQGLIEVIIDTLGVTTIDSTYNKKGRLINGSQFLSFPYTPSTKFWVRRVKSTLIANSQIQLRKPVENINVGGVDAVDGALRTIAGYGDLTQDAWGHQKIVQDVSLFSSAFTFNIDRILWVPFENEIEIYYDTDLTKLASLNGKLVMSSGANIGDSSSLASRRHPRYQPNRGHLYSSSIFLPSKNAIGIRNFGLLTSENGAFFSFEDGVLYATVRTTVNDITSEPFKEAIDLVALGLNIDYEKGNIYDIQMQWRGVGDIKWFIGDPSKGVSTLVAKYNHLNTSVELSIANPSMHAGYECINTDGTDVSLEGGCVDVTSENGFKGNRSYSSTTTGEVITSTLETPMIAFRIPHLFDGKINTRDLVLTAISAYADVNMLIRLYYFRDPTAITATFSPIREGFQEEAIGTAVTAFDNTKMVNLFETRVPALDSKQFTNPDKGGGDLYLTHGDYLFVTMQGKNNSLGGITLEYAVEI